MYKKYLSKTINNGGVAMPTHNTSMRSLLAG
jgi:hypothetical protein